MRKTLITLIVAGLALPVLPALAQTTGEKIKEDAHEAKDNIKDGAKTGAAKVKKAAKTTKNKVKAGAHATKEGAVGVKDAVKDAK